MLQLKSIPRKIEKLENQFIHTEERKKKHNKKTDWTIKICQVITNLSFSNRAGLQHNKVQG